VELPQSYIILCLNRDIYLVRQTTCSVTYINTSVLLNVFVFIVMTLFQPFFLIVARDDFIMKILNRVSHI